MLRLTCSTLRSPICRRSLSTTRYVLSGHNKWSKIKDKKGAHDAQRGQLFSRIARDIGIAIRTGGSADPNFNHLLATAIKKAKDQDVPKDNIERAIEKAQGKGKKGEVVMYEALAFDSVGILIESLSDNLNRTISHLREIFHNHGAQKAAVMYMFKKVGRVDVSFPIPEGSATDRQEALLDLAMENNMEDFDILQSDEEGIQVMKLYCPPEHLAQLVEAVAAHPDVEIQEQRLTYVSSNTDNAPMDEDKQEKLTKLLDHLWANEDTLNVWTTMDKM